MTTDTVTADTIQTLTRAESSARAGARHLREVLDALQAGDTDAAAKALYKARWPLIGASGRVERVTLLAEWEWDMLASWAAGSGGIDLVEEDETIEETTQVWEHYRAEAREELESLARRTETKDRARAILAQWDHDATPYLPQLEARP